MSIEDLAKGLEEWAQKFEELTLKGRKFDKPLIDFPEYGGYSYGSCCNQIGQTLHKAYRLGEFDKPVFAELNAAMKKDMRSDGHSPERATFTVIEFLEDRGYTISGGAIENIRQIAAALKAEDLRGQKNMPTFSEPEKKVQALQSIIKMLKKTRERGLPSHLLHEATHEAFRKADELGAFTGPRWAGLTIGNIADWNRPPRNPAAHRYSQVMSYAKDNDFVKSVWAEGTYSFKGMYDEFAWQLIELLEQEVALVRLQAEGNRTAPPTPEETTRTRKKKRAANTDKKSVTEVADTCRKSKGRISQLCKEGEIKCWGKGSGRKVSLISAQEHFARVETRKTRKADSATARKGRADTREVVRDDKNMRLGSV